MRTSSSGFLLLLIGAIGLIGFLTGNLDRWLGYLFSAGTATEPVTGVQGGTLRSAGDRRTTSGQVG